MKIFALGDLHLPGGADKPMDVFGPAWDEHPARIARAWEEQVGQEDLVLIPGDVSWAMKLSDAQADLDFLSPLPGKKLLLRGNHDYWWNSLAKVRGALPPGCFALQNDCFLFGEAAICGTRGWICPGSVAFREEQDRSIYERELIRLKLSLDAAPQGANLICMLHFPPFNEKRKASGFTDLMEQKGVKAVVYGHLHDRACQNAFEGERGGAQYYLCSADHLGFAPRLIYEE